MQKMRLLLFLAIIILMTVIVNAKILVYEDEENACPIIILKQETSVSGERETEKNQLSGLVCCDTQDGYTLVFQDYCINELRGNLAPEAMCARVCCQQKLSGMEVSRWNLGLAGNCRGEGSISQQAIMCEQVCCKINKLEVPEWHKNMAGDEPISRGACEELTNEGLKGETLPIEECDDICCKHTNQKTGLQTLNVLGPTVCNRNGGQKVDLPVEACESYSEDIQPGLADIPVCCMIQDNGPGQNTRHQILPSKECKDLGKFGGTTTEVVAKEACKPRDKWRISTKKFCLFNPKQYSGSEPQINPPQGLVFAGQSIRYAFAGPPEETRCFTCRFNKEEQTSYFDEVNCNQKLSGYDWNRGNVNAGDDSYGFGIPNACVFGPATTGEQGSTAVTVNFGESVRYTYLNGNKGCFTCSYAESSWAPELRSVDCSQVSNAYDLSAERMEGITPEGLRGSYSPITGQSFRNTRTTSFGFFAKITAFFSSIFN